MPARRRKPTSFVLDPTAKSQLEDLMRHEHRTRSNMVEVLIRRAYEAQLGPHAQAGACEEVAA